MDEYKLWCLENNISGMRGDWLRYKKLLNKFDMTVYIQKKNNIF